MKHSTDLPKTARAQRETGRRGGRKGIALVEFGMTAIVLFLMMLMTFNFGVYATSFLAIQNASRVAALRNSGGIESATDQAAACAMVIEELRGLPGIDDSFSSDCSSGAVVVTSQLCDTDNPCSDAAGATTASPSVLVRVAYTLPDLFQLPVAAPGVIARGTEAKIRAIP